MNPNSPIRPGVYKSSIFLASAAWLAFLCAPLRVTFDDRAGWLILVISWPFGYALCLALLRGAAWLSQDVDDSLFYGPAKELQVKLVRGPMLIWINAVAVIFPAAGLCIAVLGMLFKWQG